MTIGGSALVGRPAPGNTAAPILVRGDHQLQIGCDPEHSLLVDLPAHVAARAVVELLDEPPDSRQLPARLAEIGLDRGEFDEIAARRRAVDAAADPPATTLRVCLHGAGPLRDGLESALDGTGHTIARSSTRRARPWRSGPDRPTLVVLSDFALHDPLVVADLMHHRVPHLPVVLRDGVGVVGPLVLPGRSSCLRCADHHRATMDPQWPLVSAQLVNRAGTAGTAITRLTVGVVLEQIEQIAAGLAQLASVGDAGPAPDLVDRTVEIHPRPLRLRHKPWPAHPNCHCGSHWRMGSYPRPSTILAT